MIMNNTANEAPVTHRRNDRLGFDRWEWPDGLGVNRYDDGRIKIGMGGEQAVQTWFESRGPGKSGKAAWHAEFAPKPEQA